MIGKSVGLGSVNVAFLEREVDVAGDALGQGRRAVAGAPGIGDLPAAGRAVNHEAYVLGGGLLVGLRLQLEPELADGRDRVTGPVGDAVVKLAARHDGLLPPRPDVRASGASPPRLAGTGRGDVR